MYSILLCTQYYNIICYVCLNYGLHKSPITKKTIVVNRILEYNILEPLPPLTNKYYDLRAITSAYFDLKSSLTIDLVNHLS